MRKVTSILADSSNQRVRRADPEGIITTAAGNGSRGSARGDIYVADRGNHRIRLLQPE